MEWLVYDVQSFDIVGFGDSAAAARLSACRDSNMLPGDFGLESWAEVDFESDGYPRPDNWATATQEQYRAALESHVIACNS